MRPIRSSSSYLIWGRGTHTRHFTVSNFKQKTPHFPEEGFLHCFTLTQKAIIQQDIALLDTDEFHPLNLYLPYSILFLLEKISEIPARMPIVRYALCMYCVCKTFLLLDLRCRLALEGSEKKVLIWTTEGKNVLSVWRVSFSPGWFSKQSRQF